MYGRQSEKSVFAALQLCSQLDVTWFLNLKRLLHAAGTVGFRPTRDCYNAAGVCCLSARLNWPCTGARDIVLSSCLCVFTHDFSLVHGRGHSADDYQPGHSRHHGANGG